MFFEVILPHIIEGIPQLIGILVLSYLFGYDCSNRTTKEFIKSGNFSKKTIYNKTFVFISIIVFNFLFSFAAEFDFTYSTFLYQGKYVLVSTLNLIPCYFIFKLGIKKGKEKMPKTMPFAKPVTEKKPGKK